MKSDYKSYSLGVRIQLKDGSQGDAFESFMGFISVFMDDKD